MAQQLAPLSLFVLICLKMVIRDLKSLGGNPVRVRVPPSAPSNAKSCRSGRTIAMFAPNPNRRLRETLFLGAVVIGATALGAVVLYAATSWLWLVIHEGLR